MNQEHPTTNRRRFVLAAGAAAGTAALGLEGPAVAQPSDIEKANEAVVMEACKAIDALDTEKLGSHLADDFVFQLFDGQPLIEGKEAFLTFFGQFVAPYERADFDIHRSFVLGNLVINHRSDHFFAKEGGENQTFEVTGFCVVKNGLIHEWKDYGLPS
jgi:limonene-1,2-epoxide hydrolase